MAKHRLRLASIIASCAALLLLAACGSSTPLATNGQGTFKLTASQQNGQTLFKSTCSSCHTLSAAHATGTIGPNLDMLRPPAPAVMATISSGLGRMPAHLLTGKSEQVLDLSSPTPRVARSTCSSQIKPNA